MSRDAVDKEVNRGGVSSFSLGADIRTQAIVDATNANTRAVLLAAEQSYRSPFRRALDDLDDKTPME